VISRRVSGVLFCVWFSRPSLYIWDCGGMLTYLCSQSSWRCELVGCRAVVSIVQGTLSTPYRDGNVWSLEARVVGVSYVCRGFRSTRTPVTNHESFHQVIYTSTQTRLRLYICLTKLPEGFASYTIACIRTRSFSLGYSVTRCGAFAIGWTSRVDACDSIRGRGRYHGRIVILR